MPGEAVKTDDEICCSSPSKRLGLGLEKAGPASGSDVRRDTWEPGKA